MSVIDILKNNTNLDKDCIPCIIYLFEKIFEKDGDITQKIVEIKENNTFEIYKKLYSNPSYHDILPPRYFFMEIDDDITFVIDTENKVHIELNKKDIFTGGEIEIQKNSDIDYWIVLTENTFGFLNIDDYPLQIMGNVILKIISQFSTIEEGEKWMLDHKNVQITHKEYFRKFMCYLTSIIMTDLWNTYPNKSKHNSHDIIMVILNNKDIKNLL